MIRRSFKGSQYTISDDLIQLVNTVRRSIRQDDHHFSGLHERRCHHALGQSHLPGGIGSDDRSDLLIADTEGYLGQQPIDLQIQDSADELVAPADATESLASLGNRAALSNGSEIFVYFRFGNAMVSAGCKHRLQLPAIDPLFNSGIADAKYLGSVAWSVEFHGVAAALLKLLSGTSGLGKGIGFSHAWSSEA